jgi:hypothetical protein
MKILRIFIAFALLVAGVISTVGSGGGGSGGGSGLGPINLDITGPLPEPEPVITVENAQEVAAWVVQAIDQLLDVSVKISGQIFPDPPSAPSLLSSNSKYELIATATDVVVVEPCAVDGTVAVMGNSDNEPAYLSQGDGFTIIFYECNDGDGLILDGRFNSVLVSELEGDPRSDVFRLRYKFLSMTLTITSINYNYQMSSSMQKLIFEWDSLSFPEIVLATTPGNLILNSYADNYHNHAIWESDPGEHSLTFNADTSIPAKQIDARITVMGNGDNHNRDVVYEVIFPLQVPNGQELESGEIQISDIESGNKTIRIVTESSTSVRLEVDSNGDGIVDDYQYTTWTMLKG